MANPKNNRLRNATPEEMKQHQENHPKLIQAIRQAHGKTMRFVRKRYGQSPEILHNDRGN